MKQLLKVIAIIFAISRPGFNQTMHGSSLVAFVNINLVPMTSEIIIPNQTVLVEDGKIIEIGIAKEIHVPKHATVINSTDSYLMPGLADMHVHLTEFDHPVLPLHMFIAKGVTTVRDLSGESLFMLRWRREVERGDRIGPRIIAGGPIFHATPKSVPEELQLQRSLGFEFIKLYTELPSSGFLEIMKEADKFDSYSIGHMPMSIGFDGMIAAGMDEIAHVSEIRWGLIPYDRNQNFTTNFQWWDYRNELYYNEFSNSKSRTIKALRKKYHTKMTKLTKDLKEANISVISTLNHEGSKREYDLEAFMARKEIPYQSKDYIESLQNNYPDNKQRWSGIEWHVSLQQTFDRFILSYLYDNGVQIVLGTDAQTAICILPGFAVHQELKIMLDYGLSPFEAIKSATVNASQVVEAMNGNDDFGTIEVGKRADLVLTDSNPFKKISSIEDNLGVMASGVWYPREKLNEMMAIEDRFRPKSGSEKLYEVIIEKGLHEAIGLYWKAKNADNKKDHALDVGLGELNRLGYMLLNAGLTAEAIEIFKLNVAENPYFANGYDSLGEAYLVIGNIELGIHNYQRAVDIEPSSSNAIRVLEELRNTSPQ